MRTLRKEPGKPWEIVEVPNELEALQKVVGGYMERVTFSLDTAFCATRRPCARAYPTTPTSAVWSSSGRS